MLLHMQCRTGSWRRCILVVDAYFVIRSPSTGRPTPIDLFLPSATLLLDFPENQRDFLGGLNAQASDKYARTSRRIITNMQRAVIRAIFSLSPDPLAEQDLAEHFEEFLTSQHQIESCNACRI